jgi:hypothetical protein
MVEANLLLIGYLRHRCHRCLLFEKSSAESESDYGMAPTAMPRARFFFCLSDKSSRGTTRIPESPETTVILVEHPPQSQKRSWMDVPEVPSFSGPGVPAATWKILPSRRYRKVAEQEGFAHFDTIAASIAVLQDQEQFARKMRLACVPLPTYYAMREQEVIASTAGSDSRHQFGLTGLGLA